VRHNFGRQRCEKLGLAPENRAGAGGRGAVWVITHPALNRRRGGFLGILPKKARFFKPNSF
jgi:hypothetical protein